MSETRMRQNTTELRQIGEAYNNDEITIDLMELMYKLLASWKLIVCAVLACAIIFGAYTQFFVTPMYEATSKIYVLSRRDSAVNMADLQIGAALTSDYIKVFQVWEVHEEVISNLNLPYSYAQMNQMISVTNDNDTRILNITVTSSNPQEAANIANEYAKVTSQFIAETMSTDKPNIMSVALVPSSPSEPNKTRNIMLGGLLGGFAAAAFVTVRMLLDDKYKSAEDIRRYTGLPMLAAVPADHTVKEGKKYERRRNA